MDTERYFLPVISLISLSGAVPPILLLRPVSLYNDRLKQTGYTTGANEGEGMGLAICAEIANRYNGKIWVVSDEYETVFEGFFPKRG